MFDLTKFIKAPKDIKKRSFLKRKYYHGIIWLVRIYNILFAHSRKPALSGLQELDDVRSRVQIRTDISDHLETLFIESLSGHPKLIVELGVGPGESTFVFERVARLTGARLVSVDMEDKKAKGPLDKDWLFVQSDDISFADRFPIFATENRLEPAIDVLFVDTSHQYAHTVQEIKKWFPLLSKTAKVFFHDTNTGPVYKRKDGSIGLAFNIDRGVIRALEDYFSTSFCEKKNFIDIRNSWIIKHFSNCNGFTVLERI